METLARLCPMTTAAAKASFLLFGSHGGVGSTNTARAGFVMEFRYATLHWPPQFLQHRHGFFRCTIQCWIK